MSLFPSRRLLTVAAALTATLLSAAAPAVAGDPGSRPAYLNTVGRYVVFQADDGTHGIEIWRTDGKTTTLLKDFSPGAADGNPYVFTVAGSLMYFNAVADGDARFWRTDGTRAGTIRLSPLSANDFPVAVGSRVYYDATDDHGTELWTSNGTVSGTKRITDIGSGIADGVRTGRYAPLGTKVAFVGLAADGSHELWTSGSTPGSAKRIKKLGTGAEITWMRNAAGTLYFQVETSPNVFELWKSDGSTGGTVKVKVLPATAAYPTAAGSTLFFMLTTPAAGSELWRTKGTAAGTRMVKDINPGPDGIDTLSLTPLGSRVLFSAAIGIDYEMWRSDGTKAGTVRVKDINPDGPSYPDLGSVIGGQVYFFASDGVHGTEPWRTDGTKAGTKPVAEVIPGPGGIGSEGMPSAFAKLGTRIYFSANDGVHGVELWRTTPTGVKLWANIKPD